MKHFLIAGLSLLIFCFTSSLAIGEEVVASLPDADSIKQADTQKNMSNLPQEPASFMDRYKEQKWNTAAASQTCEQLKCVAGDCCTEGELSWCRKPPHTCEMSKPAQLR